MAERKEEKKKAGIVRRILKWIGLGVLSSLIILGLIFEAPWKVITLLLIVLAACTVLPKQLRKWFWAGVGAVVIALIVWVFLPEADGEWRPYTFDEELAALEAKRAIPDEENAAIIYNQLLGSYDSNSFYRGLDENELKKIPMREPWLSRENPEIAEWLEKHQATISMLLNASKIEKCRFAINADLVSFDSTMDRLSPMRQWAYLLISVANNDIAEGRVDRGLEKYIAVLQMGKHQRQQPALIDFLVGAALEALSIGQFKRFIVTGDATEGYLSIIEEVLRGGKHDWSTDFPRFLEHEKLFAKNFWGMFYGVNPDGRIRLTRGLTTSMMAQLPEDIKNQRVITYWYKRLMKTWTILCWFYMPSSPQKAGDIIDAVYEQYYAMAEPSFDWQKAPEKRSTSFRLNYQYLVEYSSSVLLSGPYYHIHDTYLQVVAKQRGSRLIIALRRYKNKTGHWPESLDDIKPLAPAEIFVDPISGDSFVYKLTEENFTLYSKGKNNIDEDGQYNSKWDPENRKQKIEEDDILIWPKRRQKTKEETANDK